MSNVQVKVKRLHPDAMLPTYAHDGDSGFDLVSIEDVIIEPGDTAKVRTGLAFEIPSDCEMQIRPRSGITSKTKLRVQLGTIDSSYRGEVSVVVDNVHPMYESWSPYIQCIDGTKIRDEDNRYIDTSWIIRKGDRIAQAVIAPVIHANISEVDELSETSRDIGGFGSTGTR